jgi:hypothetical protein
MLAGLAAAAAILPAAKAYAEDTPEVAQQKRNLIDAYNAAHTTGVCDVFTALRKWQATAWPEGESAVTEFLIGRVMPQFTADAAVLQGQSAAELESEFGQFCRQSTAATLRVFAGLKQAPAEETEAANRFRDTLAAATFLGQCQTASALYLQGVPEDKERLGKFVVAEVYSRDPKYRQTAIDELDQAQENSAKETLYWKDCDTATAGFQSIFEQLKPAP